MDYFNDEDLEEEETGRSRGDSAMAHPTSLVSMGGKGSSRAGESPRKGEEE